MTKTRIATSLALVASGAAFGVPTTAQAADDGAPTEITIEGTSNIYGYVESPKKKCMDDRTVVVYRQVGKVGGGDDIKISNDTASKSGNKYVWDVGNPGIPDKFFARAMGTKECHGANSESAKQGQAPPCRSAFGAGCELSGLAAAAGDASTKVTIEGTDNVFGLVQSPKKKCMDDRKVDVMKQKGQKGGSDDEKVASDNASKSGGMYVWDVGNPGINGKFYARAKATPGCEADTSPTVINDQV